MAFRDFGGKVGLHDGLERGTKKRGFKGGDHFDGPNLVGTCATINTLI